MRICLRSHASTAVALIAQLVVYKEQDGVEEHTQTLTSAFIFSLFLFWREQKRLHKVQHTTAESQTRTHCIFNHKHMEKNVE